MTRPLGFAFAGMLLLGGCAHVPNQWQEDGPSRYEVLGSPSAVALVADHGPAEPQVRDWPATGVSAQPAGVSHWPVYFEDPFVMKSHGRDDPQKYYVGWEDYVAMPYNYARFTVNWLFLPVSMVVQPPWTVMESNGALSRQALGYDHDARPAINPAAHREPPKPPTESLPLSESPEIPGTDVPSATQD